MKNVYIWLLVSLCWITYACSDNEDTTPSMADTDRLENLLDKSNTDILSFKEKYGTYILYEFNDLLDFAYQFEEAKAWRSATITKLDKTDVPAAISFLKANFLNCYTENVITNYFPRKLLICSQIYGETLGVSEVSKVGYHQAVANINSMTIAGLDANTLNGLNGIQKADYIRQLHFIYLAGYLVNARGNYYPNSVFFDYCATLYNSLMNTDRLQAKNFPDAFFYEKGFFRLDDEETYYGSAEEDLINFTKNLILMDQTLHDTLLQYELMTKKMQLVAKGLKDLGVQVELINPLIADFL